MESAVILDVKTLYAMIAFAASISSVMMLVHWRVTPSVKGLVLVAGGFVFFFFGSVFPLLQRLDPTFITKLTASAFIIGGLAFIWVGLLQFWNQRLKRAILVSSMFLAVTVMAQCYYFFVDDNLNLRYMSALYAIGFLNLIVGLSLGRIIYIKAPVRNYNIRPTYLGLWTLIAASMINFVSNIGRAITWDIAYPDYMFFEPMLSTYVTLLGGLMAVILMPMGIITMTGECLEARTKASVIIDLLTGAHNRDSFMEMANLIMARAERHGEPLSLLVIDLDDFKAVNDSFGHASGDAVLGALGRRLLNQKRAQDVLGRIGGDEFVLLLPMTGDVGAALVADRIRNLIKSRPVYAGGSSISATISIGVATAEQDGQTYGQLFERADKAMYQAKRTGKDRFQAA